MIIERYKDELARNGIVEIDCDSISDENLLTISSMFGRVVPGARGELIQPLPARDVGSGPKGSFSHIVGYGAFPWHTDTAYWEIPARYLLLSSDKESSCATLYQDLNVIKQSIPDYDYLISRAVYLLDVKGKKRYLSPLFEVGEKRGVRLDFHIYRPANKEAILLNEIVGKELKDNCRRLIWTGKNAVILDNWRVIHAREDARDDKKRVLKRVYINELD